MTNTVGSADPKILEDRYKQLDTITLKHGKHSTSDEGMCLLELESWLAGEPFSDHPECVCPALGAFGRAWNDALSDADRNRILGPFRGRLIGTRSTPDVQDARAFMASDWAVRVFTPAWLRLAGLEADAVALEQLPAMTSAELCRAAMPVIAAAKQSAAAAWDAAGDAARAAARDAARDAAWAALAPTTLLLQTSAADLFDRMINLTAVPE